MLKRMRKAMVGPELAVVIFIGLGYGWLSGLVVGDAQWQKLTNAGKCDSKHYIYTVVPVSNPKDGGFIRYKLEVPCSEWPEKKQ